MNHFANHSIYTIVPIHNCRKLLYNAFLFLSILKRFQDTLAFNYIYFLSILELAFSIFIFFQFFYSFLFIFNLQISTFETLNVIFSKICKNLRYPVPNKILHK